jgi:glycosyltransferase involved in cell wall biosynthesis
MDNPILVSIITVCYNAADTIEMTIKSVVNQSYKNIDYIIVDGKSTDNTLEIISKYKNQINILISEEDSGIYDAMNKGLKKSHGSLIYFLNSGDLFFDNHIVQKIVNLFLLNGYPGIIYGDIIQYDSKRNELVKMKRRSKSHILTRGGINHQAIFAQKQLFDEQYPFNINYQVFADFDWLLKAIFMKKTSLLYVEHPIAYYLKNGYSEVNLRKRGIERLEIINKYLNYYEYRKMLKKNPLEFFYLLIVIGHLQILNIFNEY